MVHHGASFGTLLLTYYGFAGRDVSALLQKFSLTAELLAEIEGVPPETIARLADAVASELSDPHVGLHLVQAVPPGAYGLLEYVACTSPNIGEAFLRLVRYHRVVSRQWSMSVHPGPDEWTFEIAPRGGKPPGQGRHYHEAFLGSVAVIAGHIGTQALLRRVWFANEAPPDMKELQGFFKVDRILFDCSTSGFAFDASLAATPLPSSDPHLLALLERYATMLSVSMPSQEDFPGRVRAAVRDALSAGEPKLESVAKALALSTRTLQRRLQELETSFHKEVDAVRRDLAFGYLAQPALAPGEIAFLLGYSQPQDFWRAFRRWSGMTPQQYRSSGGHALSGKG
jgi:AraC-like DNA-binding protein